MNGIPATTDFRAATSTSDTAIDRLDWSAIAGQLDAEGHAVLGSLLPAAQCHALAGGLEADDARWPTRVPLAALGRGRGDLFPFDEELPALLQAWRTAFYRRLAPLADRWSLALGETVRYPAELDAFLRRNRAGGQTRALSHLHRLRAGDEIALHQCADGEHVFPLQLVALLSAPGRDFTGGEFVMTEQRPRMQTRPAVVPLRSMGDVALVCTARRPVQGRQGSYRVNLKQAVSRVHAGTRIGLTMSFHDGP